MTAPAAENPAQQKCKCGEPMVFVWCWDDDEETDHAFNIFACENCGRILKVMVTEDNRETWVED